MAPGKIRMDYQQGAAGRLPFAEGLQPEGLQPEGLQPEGLQPEGLQPEGLQPEVQAPGRAAGVQRRGGERRLFAGPARHEEAGSPPLRPSLGPRPHLADLGLLESGGGVAPPGPNTTLLVSYMSSG